MPTTDGGIIFEVEDEPSGKDLLLALPEDGSILYFTARGPDGFKRAGVVSDEVVVGFLVDWVVRVGADFPKGGLLLG